MQNMRYQIWSSFPILSVNCTQVTWPPWWCHGCNFLSPQHIWQSWKSIVYLKLEMPNLVLIFYLVCKLNLSNVTTIWCHGCNSFVILTYLTKFVVNTSNRTSDAKSGPIFYLVCKLHSQVTWSLWWRHKFKSYVIQYTWQSWNQ